MAMSAALFLALFYPDLPSPFDWMPLVFRLIAVIIAFPFLLVTLIEVAGYLVVRTLGFHFRVPVTRGGIPNISTLTAASGSEVTSTFSSPVLLTTSLPSDASTSSSPDSPTHLPSHTSTRKLLPHRLSISPPDPNQIGAPLAFFVTPGEHDFALGGADFFSPRNSPPTSPHSPARDLNGVSLEGLSSGEAVPRTFVPDMGTSDLRSRHSGMRGGFAIATMSPIEAR